MKKQYLTCDCDIVEDIELQECRVISEVLPLTGLLRDSHSRPLPHLPIPDCLPLRDSHSRPLPHLPIPDCLPLLEPIIEVIK